MDPSTNGVGAAAWVLIILFCLRKRGPLWTTAFRVFAWMFGFGISYRLFVGSGGVPIGIYTLAVMALAVICFVYKKEVETCKIGFIMSLIYLGAFIIGIVRYHIYR